MVAPVGSRPINDTVFAARFARASSAEDQRQAMLNVLAEQAIVKHVENEHQHESIDK